MTTFKNKSGYLLEKLEDIKNKTGRLRSRMEGWLVEPTEAHLADWARETETLRELATLVHWEICHLRDQA